MVGVRLREWGLVGKGGKAQSCEMAISFEVGLSGRGEVILLGGIRCRGFDSFRDRAGVMLRALLFRIFGLRSGRGSEESLQDQ